MTRSWRLGPLPAAVLLAVPAIPLGFLGVGIFCLHAAQGDLFGRVIPWSDGYISGFWIYPDRIKDYFRFYTVLAGVTFAMLALALCLSDRRTRGGYLAFAIPATVMCCSLILCLTVPASWLLNYIWGMGFTAARVEGLAYVCLNYAAILFLLYRWVWRSPQTSRPR